VSERDSQSHPDPSVSLQTERRAFVRMASDLAANCRPSPRRHDAGWLGKVRDISQNGLGLLLRHRFRPGTVLTVELRSNSGKLLRTVNVKVLRAAPCFAQGHDCWLLGCVLDQQLTEEELQALL
jgi:hypothetical protein